MSKYKKEIKHCEKCNKPFSVFPNSTETLCAKCKEAVIEDTLRKNGYAPKHRFVRSNMDSVSEQQAIVEAEFKASCDSNKFAVTAEKHSKFLVQNAFSLNCITWHCPSVARLAVK